MVKQGSNCTVYYAKINTVSAFYYARKEAKRCCFVWFPLVRFVSFLQPGARWLQYSGLPSHLPPAKNFRCLTLGWRICVQFQWAQFESQEIATDRLFILSGSCLITRIFWRLLSGMSIHRKTSVVRISSQTKLADSRAVPVHLCALTDVYLCKLKTCLSSGFVCKNHFLVFALIGWEIQKYALS